jgi:Flavin containing amine oxidoreductase
MPLTAERSTASPGVETASTVAGVNDYPQQADVVFVGAGHNALVAAAYLLDAERSVALLEQMDRPGGWVRTEELRAPGFLHDRWSSLHPAFVGGPAWAELGPDLSRHGLEYVTAPLATGSSLADGRSAVVPLDPEAFVAELERLGETAGWGALFAGAGPHLQPLLGLLGAGLDGPEAEATLAAPIRDGRAGPLPFGQLLAGSAVELVSRFFATEELRSLAAPWPLHIGAGPEDPAGALWAAFALAALAGGNPTPVGGSGRLADALVGLVTERGGDVFSNVEVDEILVRDGRAVGVRTADGQTVHAGEAVIASTTPNHLYARLLRGASGVPAGVRAQADGYRFRRGALGEPQRRTRRSRRRRQLACAGADPAAHPRPRRRAQDGRAGRLADRRRDVARARRQRHLRARGRASADRLASDGGRGRLSTSLRSAAGGDADRRRGSRRRAVCGHPPAAHADPDHKFRPMIEASWAPGLPAISAGGAAAQQEGDQRHEAEQAGEAPRIPKAL